MINSFKFLPKDFTIFRTPFTNFLHQICFSKIQATVLHENTQVFCLSFSVLHFMILISGAKSVNFAQKFRIFLKFFTLVGTLLCSIVITIIILFFITLLVFINMTFDYFAILPASRSILPEVDVDFTYCWLNRPRNYFAM